MPRPVGDKGIGSEGRNKEYHERAKRRETTIFRTGKSHKAKSIFSAEAQKLHTWVDRLKECDNMTIKPVSVTPINDYKLLIEFSNKEKKIFDVKPYITGSWYGMLADISFFKTVHISGKTVEWADGQDIAPHELYELSVPA